MPADWIRMRRDWREEDNFTINCRRITMKSGNRVKEAVLEVKSHTANFLTVDHVDSHSNRLLLYSQHRNTSIFFPIFVR